MEMEMILKIIFVGMVHWALAGIALRSLVERKRVLGGRKVLWFFPVALVSCFGSLTYLIVHELVTEPRANLEYDGWR